LNVTSCGFKLSNFVNKCRDQFLLRSITDMRRTKRLGVSMIVVAARDQCPNADNRVIDVLREFLAEFCSNFIVALAVVTIRRSVAS
jgi:hypothetical protein